jgi:two-component system, NarL family, captular synthesis response regulator RcsB
MIDRVLIAEDHESASISIQKTLQDLHIAHTDYVYYCDDALLKIKTCKNLNQPYDLLITDLYFEEDSRVQNIAGGIELIAAAYQVQPDLKVLVFSAENKATVLDTLFNKHEIDGYVRKSRNDSKELHLAILQLSQNRRYFPRHVVQLIKQKNSHEFSEFDIAIISLLANGVPQKNIPAYLAQKQIRPSGLSSVEKRLNHIKSVLDFSKNEQLVAFCKDMGII